ncbi:MAG: HAD family hydrolase [Vulcanisaeta sp.]|nr:HAD family hydrolase [Vulcanisaeta sp.]
MSYRSTDNNEEALRAEVNRVKAVVFDLDGTLVDTVPLHVMSWIETCRRLNLPIPPMDYVQSLMGLRALDIARLLCGDENAEAALRIKNEVYLSLINNAKPMNNALEVLRTLKERGFMVGIVTSSSRYVALKVLEVTGLIRYVDAIVAGDDVERGKPSAEPLLKLLSMWGLGVDEVVVVGDSRYDVDMARNAGVNVVFLLGGSGDSHVVGIKDLADILRFILRNQF